MSGLPFKPIEDLMHDAGGERVSDRAVNAMQDILEDYVLEITSEAMVLAKHGRRQTIKKDDILLALRRLRGV